MKADTIRNTSNGKESTVDVARITDQGSTGTITGRTIDRGSTGTITGRIMAEDTETTTGITAAEVVANNHH
jgi:hypothetical protein